MRLHVSILFVLFLQSAISVGFSQKGIDNLLNIQLDTNIILIGDQINLTIQANLPQGMHLEFPDFNDSITHTIEIIEKFSPDTIELKNNNLLQVTHKYLITCFDSGLHFIPPMDFNIRQANFDNYITSDSIGLYVGTFEIDTTKGFFDIKPPIKTPLSWSELKPYFFVALIVFLIIATIALVILYIVGKKRGKSFFRKSKPKLPPHKRAFLELKKIKKKRLYQQNKTKQYYTEITDVLRIYLEDRYSIHTLEKTTAEIITDIKNNVDLEKNKIVDLNSMMHEADLVKFAKKIPLENDNEYFWKNAYNFIDETKFIEELTEENQDNERN